MRVIPFAGLRRAGAGFLLLTLALSLGGPQSALAAWTEDGHEILSLSEVLAELGPDSRSDLDGNLPVLLPRNLDIHHPKALAIALVQSGFALAGETGAWEISRPPLAEVELAERRRVSAFPITPRSGDSAVIAHGGLIAYGRFVDGPFLVEERGGEVLINNVRVYPTLGIDVAPPSVSPEQANSQGRIDAAWNRYGENQLNHGENAAREAYRQEALGWPDTESAEWLNDTILELTKDDGSSVFYSFDQNRREADADPEAARLQLLQGTADGLRKSLDAGYTVVAGATYLFTVGEAGAPTLRARIEEIREGGESDLMKLARLQARLGRREAAADLLYAY